MRWALLSLSVCHPPILGAWRGRERSAPHGRAVNSWTILTWYADFPVWEQRQDQARDDNEQWHLHQNHGSSELADGLAQPYDGKMSWQLPYAGQHHGAIHILLAADSMPLTYGDDRTSRFSEEPHYERVLRISWNK
jgi:hypothetical protein